VTSLRVAQVITRCVRGGAFQVVRALLDRLPREEYEQTLISGLEAAPAGARVVPELVREISPWLDAAALARLAGIFAKERPDVIHAHTYKAGVLACVAGRLAGVPAILFTPHGHIFARGASIPGVPGGLKLEVLRGITRLAQGCADRVTALSEPDLQQQLALRLSPASKYVVVRNGIDAERFAGPRPRLVDGGPIIGAVGRFSEEKGHRSLLEAIAMLHRSLSQARLVLVGYGALEEDLKRRCGELGLQGVVTFAGERDSADVLGGFDLFVQPSLYESQGIAILEAMAAGVPVVATDVGGVRDAVRHEETGLLVPPAAPSSMSGAILRLLVDHDLRGRIIDRAGRDVRERYSASGMVDTYAKLYRELLA
jgi:glycosyltransferase involved in cell wall biosynthesis